jgi:predicted nucleic acid-binding protein
MIAYLRDEPGAGAVEALLTEEPPQCIAHAMNMCEVFYYFLRLSGEEAARAAVDELRAVGLLVRDDLDEAFWQQVGRYKALCGIPLGDAFAAALASRFDAEVVTSDHGDFDDVNRRGICRVKFIR